MRAFRHILVIGLATISGSLAAMPACAQSAQRQAQVAAAEQRAASQFWDAFRTLRSSCENAAWTLWHSNSYDQFRTGKSRIMSMHYSSRFYPTLPPGPQAVPEPYRTSALDAMTKANEVLRAAGPAFSSLADYINAKDYTEDKYKKGDEINKRLLAAGRDCFDISQGMTTIFVSYADARAPQLLDSAADKQAAAQRLADWRMARGLAEELAKGTKVDLAALESKTKAFSEMVETRLANPTLAESQLYKDFNKDVAVELRRTIREIKEKPRSLQEYGELRPRSRFVSLRNEIDFDASRTLLDELMKK